ncbi:MAG TPA: ABC transporter substrate-binding protein, partial [Ruminococcaceae bacterium]|nr:ABC transporter substrate-binding protein [Oscillospiraceae bacterium]
MKAVKIISSLAVILSLLFSMAGCTAGNKSNTGSTASSTSQAAVKKPEQLYLYMDVLIEEKDGAAQAWAEFEKQTGIKLKVVKPEHAQYSEKLSTMFMSNDIPDVVEVWSTDYMKFASQKAFAPLKKYIQNSPSLSKVDAGIINALEYNGEIYGVQKELGNGSMTYIRKDWLDRLKINIPKTYDEFYNMLIAFRDNDPDGSGKKDTIPYTLSLKNPDNALYMTDLLIDARFDFYKKDGKWVDGFSEDAMLKAFERMAKLYQEKLLEPEIFTLSTADTRTKFYTGNTGCFAYWAGKWADTINTEIKKNLKDASVVPMPALQGGYYINRVAPAYAIPAKPASGDPEAVFKYFFDYIFDSGKGTMW